jgi:hypothetical protein
MDKVPLVDRDIDAGRRLVQALDQAGFPVVAALWNYIPEADDWRLVIASPRVTELGERAAYSAIQEASYTAQVNLPLFNVSALAPEEPPVEAFRIGAGTDPAPFLGGTSYRRTVVGDTYVEGAYVYRAEHLIAPNGTVELWVAVRDRSRKVWTAHRCKVTAEDGIVKKVEVEGCHWPQRHVKGGVSARLTVLTNPEKRGDKTVGDVRRWHIVAGRLQSIETVARGVRIEGYAENVCPSVAPA